jgi:hypothetical protein
MKANRVLILLPLFLAAAVCDGLAATLSSAFTFQGRLVAGGNPANGSYDLRLALFNASSAGTQVGDTLTNQNVSVSNGLFTTFVDFGSAVFDGTTYWVDVAVRPGGTTNPFRLLSPRQRLTGTPYALFAAGAPWSGLSGVPAGFSDGVDDNTTYSAGDGLSLVGTQFRINFSGSGSAVTASRSDHTHSGAAIVSGVVSASVIDSAIARDSEVFSLVTASDGPGSGLNADLLDGLDSTEFWKAGGNSGTTPNRDYLGTSDNAAFELRVNTQRALRLEPNATSPNVIGGYRGNFVSSVSVGATISGGGTTNDGTGVIRTNRINANYGTVGGGIGQIVDAPVGTIGGGRENAIKSTATNATIPGGFGAVALNYGQHAYASGSFTAAGDAQTSTYVVRGVTVNDITFVDLHLDGSSEAMKIPVDTRWAFDVLVVASTTGSTTAAYQLRGAIKNIGGTTSMLAGAPPLQTLGADAGTGIWTVSAIADNTEDALVIQVKGGPATTVHWVASVRVVELTF